MFWVIVLLLFFSVILILLEIILPYGISMVIGLLVLGLSIYLFREHDPQTWGWYTLVATGLALGAAVYVLKSGVSLLTLKPVDPPEPPERAATEDAATWPRVGDQVEAVQPLRPTGTVLWEGRRYPARCTRYEVTVPVGAKLKVTGLDSTYLLVVPVEGADSEELKG